VKVRLCHEGVRETGDIAVDIPDFDTRLGATDQPKTPAAILAREERPQTLNRGGPRDGPVSHTLRVVTKHNEHWRHDS
jgi:hypothetical protein